MDTTSTTFTSLPIRLRPVVLAFAGGLLAACAFYHAVNGEGTEAFLVAVLMLGGLIRACSRAERAAAASPESAGPSNA